MSTTLIFVELLSAGTLAVLALTLGLLGLGVDAETLATHLGGIPAVWVVVGLAIAYPLVLNANQN